MKVKTRSGGRYLLRRYFPHVTTISDALKHTAIVTVKEQDTAKSKKGDFGECAFAKACKRQLKVDGALIGLAYSYLVKGNHATRYITGQALAREITTFDRHRDFDLGEYRLSPIPPSQRMGHRVKKGSNLQGNGGTKPHRILHSTARVRRMRGKNV